MRAAARMLVLCAAALSCAPALAQERRLEPLDEGAQDPSWTSFRESVLQALARRDREFILGILHPEVRSGLDGRRGAGAFGEQWGLDAESGPLWRELAAVLALPSAWHRPESGPPELCVPYVAVRWPQDMDAYRGGAIVTGSAPVKAAPAPEAKTLATLAFHMVEVADWEVPDRDPAAARKWVRIRLGSGEGYVRDDQIRSPIEHAACFVKGEDGWRLAGFGPGAGK